MSVDVYQVGVDHHLAPLEVRERIALDTGAASKVARSVQREAWAGEVALISTCNRTELYVTTEEPAGADLALAALIKNVPGAPEADSGYYRLQRGAAAAAHLLRVACGLESALIGETEIQGQVRRAHMGGREEETIGVFLDRLFQTALRTGKRARTETQISSGGTSHGSAVAEVVRRIFDRLDDRTVLVAGAGTMARQAARALAELGAASFEIVNRTPEHAQALAADLPRATVQGLAALESILARAHVAVFATGAERLDAQAVAAAVHRRRDPLLLVDLGVPRCVAAEAAALPGVFLYDLPALERMVAGSLTHRREAVPAVESIIAAELADFDTWRRGRGAAPAIHSLNEWAEAIRQDELRHLPGDTPEQARATIERVTQRLVRRLLGRAAARVVKGAGGDPDLPTPEDLTSVFGLEEGEQK